MKPKIIQRGELDAIVASPPSEPSDAAQAWLVDALVDLLGTARAHVAAAPAPTRLALVLRTPHGRDAGERALAEGLAGGVRGAAQSLARELAPATRVNAVLVEPATELDGALSLLADADGGFVTGATLDLRGAA